jgi:hypothetical protein
MLKNHSDVGIDMAKTELTVPSIYRSSEFNTIGLKRYEEVCIWNNQNNVGGSSPKLLYKKGSTTTTYIHLKLNISMFAISHD